MLYVGYNITTKTVKFADDIDLLPCDVHHVRQVDANDLMQRVQVLEKNGYHVTIDRDGQYYETREDE